MSNKPFVVHYGEEVNEIPLRYPSWKRGESESWDEEGACTRCGAAMVFVDGLNPVYKCSNPKCNNEARL